MSKTPRFLIIIIMAFLTVAAKAQQKIGAPAPDFIARTSTGKDLKLSDYRGRVVLLDFWASWCMPCRDEMPALISFYRLHRKDDFEIIAVNIDNSETNMRRFISEMYPRPGFPIVVDKEKHLPELYQIAAMPTTVLIDREGIVRYWHNGFKKSYVQAFESELGELLSAEQEPQK